MGYAFASEVETVQVNNRLRRIVLEVPELDRLQLPNAGDAAVGIYFQDANRPKRPPPMECRDGVWGYYDETTAPPGRTYSIRNHDPIANRINVDVVLHGHGVGSTWAQTAALASEVVVAHGRSWYRPVPSTDWQLHRDDGDGQRRWRERPGTTRRGAAAPIRSRLLLVRRRGWAVTRGAKVSARSTSLGCSAIRYPRLLAARLRGVG